MALNIEINNLCVSCDNCRIICPESAVVTDGKTYAIDSWLCTYCELCIVTCPTDSIKIIDQAPINK